MSTSAAPHEHALLDHLVRSPEHRLRDRQPERLRGLEVNHQLELCRLRDGRVCGLGTLESPVYKIGGAEGARLGTRQLWGRG
jgi:hypothetical protein